jgi:hypothetical protein
VPSNLAIQSTKNDAKGGKKRRKWCPQWAIVSTGYNDDNDNKKAHNCNKEYIVATKRSVKHQARSSTDHFEKHLETVCPSHAYPIKHKLNDYGMMKIS